MFARLATRSSTRQSLRTLPAQARGYASAAEVGGPSFELTEEQAGIRELTRNFTVRGLLSWGRDRGTTDHS